MLVFTTVSDLEIHLEKERPSTFGFVPTMGALHEGHLVLVDQAKKENDLAVVSIFVNPAQFNNRNDLIRYPRNIERDLKMLEERGCDIVFTPSEEEIYPAGYKEPSLDLEHLETVMEGKFRPGHFKGVVMVVKRLFEIVRPDKAYFGMKDFQQIAVVRRLNKEFNLVDEIVAVPTVREKSGLAMSSRNMLLSDAEKKDAEIIYKTLVELKKQAKKGVDPASLQQWGMKNIEKNSALIPEYVEIVEDSTLLPLLSFEGKNAVACIAAWSGKVRLIDNLPIFLP